MGLASCHLSGAYTPGLDSKFLEKSYARDLTLIALAAVVKICQERNLRRLQMEREDKVLPHEYVLPCCSFQRQSLFQGSAEFTITLK